MKEHNFIPSDSKGVIYAIVVAQNLYLIHGIIEKYGI